jgi:hypothetical protein
MNKNTSQIFSLIYDSEDTKDHEIDAATLGQSLLSLHDSLQDADKVINGEDSSIKVSVKANKPGSFGVEFSIVQLTANAIDILPIIGVTAVSATAFAGSVMGVINAMKSKKVKVVISNDDGTATIEMEDGEKIVCTHAVQKLVTSPIFRNKFEALLFNDVTEKKGAKVKFLNSNEEVIQTIESDELIHFKKQTKQTVIEEKSKDKDIEISFTQVNFDSKSGWRVLLPNEESDTAVKMNDSSFLKRISSREENFIKGDFFKVKLRETTKFKTGASPSTSFSIEKVIRHRADKSRKII